MNWVQSEVAQLPSQLGYRLGCAQQRLRGESPERTNNFLEKEGQYNQALFAN
jgi:hypothetical protein